MVKLHEITDTTHWDLNVHGFCILKAKTHLDPQEVLLRKKDLQKACWYEIEALLHEKFPEYTRIESYDCTVSHRTSLFIRNFRHFKLFTLPLTDEMPSGEEKRS